MPWSIAVVLTFAALLMAPTAASADPPGPTDFRTEVKAIEPDSDAFDLRIIGGDSFVLLTQRNTVTIEILGYEGEPYLRFLPDGRIEQNRRSPAVYLNEERYGSDASALPTVANADAEPAWEVVGDDGSHAWHDHRAHWMLENTPFGKGPGDQILEGVIPAFVDGTEVDIVVASFWEPPPSPVPLVAGLAAGSAVAWLVWRRRLWAAWVLAVAGSMAVGIGTVQYLSVPAETGPTPTLVLLPLVGALSGLAAIAVRRRPVSAWPLMIGGALSLLLFSGLRLPSIGRAILPTDLPFAVDRAASGATVVMAGAVLAVATAELLQLLRR